MATLAKELSANKLRIAKRIIAGKSDNLSAKDRKIGERLLRSLKRKNPKLESEVVLRNWIDNKGGIRDRTAWRQERKDIKANLSMMGRPEIKEDALERYERKRKATPEARRDAEAKELIRIADERQKEVDKSIVPSGQRPTKKRIVDEDYSGRRPTKKRTVDEDYSGRRPTPTRRGDERITIKSGDTLSDLAKARGTTLAAIRRANPGRFPTAKSLNIIKAGEKINMSPNVGATTPYDTKTVRVKPKVVPTRQTKTESEDSTDVREQYPTKGTRRKLKPLEGGVRYIETPFGRIKMDTSDKAFNYDNPDNVTHGKRGGQVKKGVKKIKAKARRRAALRGHRAELRGG